MVAVLAVRERRVPVGEGPSPCSHRLSLSLNLCLVDPQDVELQVITVGCDGHHDDDVDDAETGYLQVPYPAPRSEELHAK